MAPVEKGTCCHAPRIFDRKSYRVDHALPEQGGETVRALRHSPRARSWRAALPPAARRDPSSRTERTHIEKVETPPTPAPTEIGRAAAVHGADLLRLGYTIDQVVHDYGDVCQSVTQLAGEQQEDISTDEFRTLNRCLDNAIADAVTSFGSARQVLINDQAETLQQRLDFYSVEHRRLVDIALQSYSAIRTGHVGVTGATGTLLYHTLGELRSLAERTLPEIRLAYLSVSVTPP
jgi:hypothetical protein